MRLANVIPLGKCYLAYLATQSADGGNIVFGKNGILVEAAMLFASNRAEVIRVHASAIMADVVQLYPVGNWAYEPSPVVVMSELHLRPAKPELSISAAVAVSVPNPTAGGWIKGIGKPFPFLVPSFERARFAFRACTRPGLPGNRGFLSATAMAVPIRNCVHHSSFVR